MILVLQAVVDADVLRIGVGVGVGTGDGVDGDANVDAGKTGKRRCRMVCNGSISGE